MGRSLSLSNHHVAEHWLQRTQSRICVDALPTTLSISDNLKYPLLRLQSVAVGGAVLQDFEVVVWGRPVIPSELLAVEEEVLIPLGSGPSTPIHSILECRGVLGLDFLRHFKLSFDLSAEMLILDWR